MTRAAFRSTQGVVLLIVKAKQINWGWQPRCTIGKRRTKVIGDEACLLIQIEETRLPGWVPVARFAQSA